VHTVELNTLFLTLRFNMCAALLDVRASL